ncbi:MAG: low temperature requirement protein A, partial [Thermoleophilaceae bacterium]
LELFFDLVFVFTITQLTAVLVREPNGRGVAQAFLILGVVWWMYGGYAWLTNAVAPQGATRRLLLLGGMAAFLALALAIPHAFAGTGLTFGIAYLVVICVHGGLFIRATATSVATAFRGIAPINGTAATMVLVGGALGGTAQYLLWAAAFTLTWIGTPLFRDIGDIEIASAHFVERHGLVVIVAIGESVVAIGIGAAGHPVDLALVGLSTLGLALSACLWWAYFGGGDDDDAERALEAAPAARRPALALAGYGLPHMAILLGVVAIAAAEKHAIGHASHALPLAQALYLAVGAALFLAGDVAFRRVLRMGRERTRAAAALLALCTVPLGTEVSAVAQLVAVTLMLVGMLALEARAAVPAQTAAG